MKIKGITLIEVLVAALILSIAISALMMIFAKQIEYSESIRKRNAAMMIIQDKFEETKANHDPGTYIAYLSKFNASNPDLVLIGNDKYKLYYDINSIDYNDAIDGYDDPKVYQIKAIVQWLDGSDKKTLEMLTRTNEF